MKQGPDLTLVDGKKPNEVTMGLREGITATPGAATIAAMLAGSAGVQAVAGGTPVKSGTTTGPAVPAVPLWMWPWVRSDVGPL
jgi:hypothetical protein